MSSIRIGNFIAHVAIGGALDSSWGLDIAPAGFGEYSSDLLVGNFGDGQIHAFDLSTGVPIGTLEGLNGNPIVIDGLWA